MLEIKDAVAVITGAGSGIGEVFAKYWVQRGGKVVIADVIPENLSRVEKEIVRLGGDVRSIFCDVTKEDDNCRLATITGRKMDTTIHPRFGNTPIGQIGYIGVCRHGN